MNLNTASPEPSLRPFELNPDNRHLVRPLAQDNNSPVTQMVVTRPDPPSNMSTAPTNEYENEGDVYGGGDENEGPGDGDESYSRYDREASSLGFLLI